MKVVAIIISILALIISIWMARDLIIWECIRDSELQMNFIEACITGNETGAEKLLKLGADPNRRSFIFSPIFLTSLQGNVNITKLLLNWGADPNAKSLFFTPLYAATHKKHEEVVNVLLEGNANPYITCFGDTPYEKAIDKKKFDIAENIRRYMTV
jgi:hypothetical protein